MSDETGAGRVPIADGRSLDGRGLREWLDIFRRLLGRYDLSALVPAFDLLPAELPGYGFAASSDGEGRYVLYIVDEKLYLCEPCEPGPVSVALHLPAGRYKVRSFNPETGAEVGLPDVESEGGVSLHVPAFAGDVAILLDLVQ